MRNKYIRKMLTIALVILAIALVSTNVHSCITQRNDGERYEQLEELYGRARDSLAESDSLLRGAIDAAEDARGELARLRESLDRAGDHIDELERRYQELEGTIKNLRRIYGDLTEGTGKASDLARKISREAFRGLEIIRRIQDTNYD